MMRFLVLPLVLSMLVSCNLSIFDQGVEDRGHRIPSENMPSTEVAFSREAPKNVAATSAYYQDRINVSWSPVDGADYYTVERAEVDKLVALSSNLTWGEIGDAKSTGFTDRSSTLQAGKYYAYRVTAHQVTKDGTIISGSVSSVSYGTLLAPPEDLSASKGESYDVITVTWRQMPGIDRYYIYRSESEVSAGLGNYVGAVAQVSTPSQDDTDVYGRFDYSVPEDEKGKELFFVIKAAGGIGAMSDQSNSRSGYTRVVGAASTPEIEFVTKGDSNSSVTIRWLADSASTDEDPISYTVLKSYAGSAETTIFPLYAGQTISPDENGIYSITDTDVTDRTEYKYSIIASNSVGMSPAASQTGYLLSPPDGIEFKPDLEKKEYHVASFDDPLGYEEVGSEWQYRVEIVNQDNSIDSPGIISRDDLIDYIGKTEFSVSGAVDFEKEPRFIRIYTVNGEVESTNYFNGIIGGLPDAPEQAVASRNQSSDLPAKGGVYPIYITCVPSGEIPTYGYRIKRSDGGFEAESSTPSFIDSNVEFAQLYTYVIESLDPFGRSAKEKLGDSESVAMTNEGYGAITGEKFKAIFESNILKPWEYLDEHPEYAAGGSKGGIIHYVAQQGMGSLGSASNSGRPIQVDGNLRTGTISYNASVGGRGGLITFSYTRYFSEAPYSFYIDGDYSYQMDVGMNGSGSVSASRAFVTGGMFPGSVAFSNLSVSNYAFTGNYVITQYCSDQDVTTVVNSAK